MITLVEPSIDILPAFNRINYTISSTNSEEVGFKYVVKVYNSDDELVTTAYYDSPADPSEPVEFDVSKYVCVDFSYSKGFYETATSSSSTNAIKAYYLKCYEYYEVGGEFVIVLASEVVSETKYAFAGALPLLELKNWYADIEEYTGSYTGESFKPYKPLTDWTNIKMRETDSQIFAFINLGYIIRFEIEVTYKNGTSQTYNVTPSAVSTPSFTYLKVTPITYGANVSEIFIRIVWSNNGGTIINGSGFANIYIQSCGRYDPMRIAYLNKYGAYDFFNFDLVNKTTFQIEKKGYERNYNGDIYEANGIVVKNVNPVYFTKETQNWRIISDYLNDTQAELIRQLYSSPLVYLNLVNDNYITPSWIPVKPNATTYEVKKTASDKLFNLELDVEFQLLNNRQVI
jgi:hypothetical protein